MDIEALKPPLREIFTQARAAGPDACREAHHQAKERAPEDAVTFESSSDCGALHVLAAVAWEIHNDAAISGDGTAIDWLIEAITMDQAAAACEQASAGGTR
jgi:hypothetical protein